MAMSLGAGLPLEDGLPLEEGLPLEAEAAAPRPLEEVAGWVALKVGGLPLLETRPLLEALPPVEEAFVLPLEKDLFLDPPLPLPYHLALPLK